jgi:hypothetical protein
VVLVVGGGVLVDFDEDDLRVVEVRFDPVGVDQCGITAHADASLRGGWCAGEKPVVGEVELAVLEDDDCAEECGEDASSVADLRQAP